MAAPIVSGSAGLLWSVNPDLTYDQVKYYLPHSTIVDAIDEDYLEADSDFAKGGHGINGDFDFYLTFDKDDETVSMCYVDPYADQSAEMILRKQ